MLATAARQRRLRTLYEGDIAWARRTRDGLLALDLLVLLFVIATSFPPASWLEIVDGLLGLLLAELAARIMQSRTPRRDLMDPCKDAVAILSFLAPVAGEPLGLLRALRLLRVLRLYRVLERLRSASPAFRRNEEAILAGANLLVFVFVMTGLVYTTQHWTRFLRLAQTLFRPAKVRFERPNCSLMRHEPDAVHCKACGVVLQIPDERL